MVETPKPRWRSWWIARLLYGRPRLFICTFLTLAIGFLLPPNWREMTRWLVAWNIGLSVYFVLSGWLMAKATSATMREQAELEDEGRFAILILTSIAALSSIGAIIAQLAVVKDLAGLQKGLHIGLAMVTILSAWLFIHLMFAQHYARVYFSPHEDSHHKLVLRGGLNFPETEDPDYLDFLYFSYVIGVASQTADVAITSKEMRRTALVHCILAFFFNSAVLALTINIAAGLMGP